MVYDAMDIARYVVNTSIEKKKPVSNLKLQKLLYYIQAAFLVETGDPCFYDEITHWRHGPVVVDVYNKFSKFIGNDIYEKQTEYTNYEFDSGFNVKLVKREFKSDDIKRDDRDLIDKVLNGLIDVGAWQLVERTHNEEPWKNTDTDDEITVESIKSFFLENNNQTRIYSRV